MKTIGKNLKRHRESVGLSQETVAKKLHVTRQTISSWETDRTLPDANNLKQLSELYNTKLDHIIKNQTTPKGLLTNPNYKSSKDEGIALLILSGISFLLAPLGLIIAPITLWRNQKINTYYFLIKTLCIIAILYNLLITGFGLSDFFNWGITTYHVR